MKNTNISAMSISTIATIVLIVIITVYSELNQSFKDFLKNLAGHHWITKGIISLIFFILVYFILKNKLKESNVNKYFQWVLISTILGFLVIFLFYAYEFFA